MFEFKENEKITGNRNSFTSQIIKQFGISVTKIKFTGNYKITVELQDKILEFRPVVGGFRYFL